MGRISNYDSGRRRRLAFILPLSLALLFLLLVGTDRLRIFERVFMVGYEGPMRLLPEISIIDEKDIQSDVNSTRRDAMIAREIRLENEEPEDRRNPEDFASERERSDLPPRFVERSEGFDLMRTYDSHAEVPYREDYVILKMVKPEYPPSALELGLDGYVMVEVYVDTQGRVAEAHVRSVYGPPSFETSSLRAVRQFLFKPASENGEPVPFWVSFLIRFNLKS